MITTLGTGSDGDIDFSQPHDIEALSQLLGQRLRLWRAEWYLDIGAGVDYEPILSLPAPFDLMFAAITANLLEHPDVTSVEDIRAVELENIPRGYEIRIEVATVYGVTILILPEF